MELIRRLVSRSIDLTEFRVRGAVVEKRSWDSGRAAISFSSLSMP